MEWLRNTDGSKVLGLGIALLFFTNYLLLMKPKRMRSLFKRAQHSLLGLKKNLNVLFGIFATYETRKNTHSFEKSERSFKKNAHSFKKNAHSFETNTRSFQKNVPYFKRTSILLIKRSLF